MSKNIVGLDFGHGVIRAAEVGVGRKGRPELHRYHEVQVPFDAVKEGVVVDHDAVVSALQWLWNVASFSTKRTIIGIGSQQVLIRELVVPTMSQQRIRESLPFRVQEMLPLPVDQALLDYYPIEEIEYEGQPHLRGLLVAATRESVLENTRAVQGAGLKVTDVDLIPFAIVRAHTVAERQGVKVYLHVGAVSTSVIVAADGVPQFVRMLPSGGADLTAALADRLSMRSDRADEMKRRFGLVAEAADLDSAAVATIGADAARDLTQTVRSTIAFYQNAHPESAVDGVVASGGGAMLRGLMEELQSGTGLPVTLSRPDGRFEIGPAVDEASFLSAGASPVVALGLTIRSHE